MISVIEVYNAVRDLANKDQKGFISPEMFNSVLPVVQSYIYGKIYNLAFQGKALRRAGNDVGGPDSLYLKAKDFMSEYLETKVLANSNVETPYEDASVFRKPENINRIISIFTDEAELGLTNVDIVYNSEKIARMLNSNLSQPTDAFPVALISDVVEILPAATGDVSMNFYRNPTSRYESQTKRAFRGDIDYKRQPVYSAQTVANGIVIPNPVDCRGFDLPEEYRDEVVREICKMIGVSLRDSVLMTYGASEK